MSTPTKESRGYRIFRLCAVVACVALVLAAAVLVYNKWPASGPESQSGGTVTVQSKDLPDGLTITEVTDANLAADAQLKELPEHLSLGPVVRIEPGGTLDEQMEITFALSQPVDVASGDAVFVASRNQPGEPWALEQATVSDDGKSATIIRKHLSDFWPFRFNPKKQFEKFLRSLSGDVDLKLNKPNCKDSKRATSDGYHFQSSGKALDACMGMAGDKREVQITNKLRYPVMVEYPGLTFVRTGAAELKLASLARFGSGNKTLLFSGDKAVYGAELKQGDKGTITTSRSDSAMMLYRLDMLLEGLMFVMSPFGGGAITKELVKHWVKLDRLLSQKACIDAALKLQVPQMISHCFGDEMLKEFFGWKSVLLAPLIFVKSVADWAIGEVQALADRFSGGDKHTVTVSRDKDQPQDKFLGEWTTHGAAYNFFADGTGTRVQAMGPCTYDSDEMCNEYLGLSWVMAGNQLVYTVQSFEARSDNGTPAFDVGRAGEIVGVSFVVSHIGKGLLEQHVQDTADADFDPVGNPYLCKFSIMNQADKAKCGA